MAYNYNDVQKLLIKSIIAEPLTIPKVSEILLLEDFSNIKLQEIYSIILNLYSNDVKITPSELLIHLEKKNIPFLQEDLLLFDNPPIDSPMTLANILKKDSIINKLSNKLKESDNLLISELNPLATIGELQKDIDNISQRLIENNSISFSAQVDECFDKFLAEEEELVPSIPTPYETLNNYLNGGLKDGQLITIGGRTGQGKSVIATNCASTACSIGKSVLFFSLEMSKFELIKRLTACHGDIPLKNLNPYKGKSQDLINKIKLAQDEIKNWKLEIRDEADVTMEHIRALAQQKAQSQEGLDLLIIDYLQLLSTSKSKSNRNRQEEVAELSRTCKILAKQLNIPIMILVQLNREAKGEVEDPLPRMADIRESAAIANDSDVILLLHRKVRDESNDPKATFILDKNRGGEAGKLFSMRCVLEKNSFQDLKEEIKTTEEETTENKDNEFGMVVDIKNTNEITYDTTKLTDNDFDDLFS